MYTSLRKEVTVLPKINSQGDVKAYATEIKEHNIWLTLEAEKKAAADKRKAEAAARAAEKAAAQIEAAKQTRIDATSLPSCKEYYDTIDEAAIDFVLQYNTASIESRCEYQASINRDIIDGVEKYSLTDLQIGDPRTGVGGQGRPVVLYDNTVAYVHTHAQYAGWQNDYFSVYSNDGITDISIAEEGFGPGRPIIAYVGVPNGNVLKYDPNCDSIPKGDREYQQRNTGHIIYDLAPIDPNHPNWN
ncbi:DUF4329 domain-containing protein [Ruminococcus flavefaciens]|uniref:DUF4329 domain-containing protein n=1 Tax=Ruminococcus flavefaciens TaxID=1265 RepID=UPI0002EC9BF4|nr:DUF4329 domain-containing protein [Ruminococcus flavefaciens]